MQRPDTDGFAEYGIAGAERQVIADMLANDAPNWIVGRILGPEFEPLVDPPVKSLRAFGAAATAEIGPGRR
jgi:hypothetical protein